MGQVIHLFRHVETTASQTGGYCGFFDPELTRAVYFMADYLADSPTTLQWASILCSPLYNAITTSMMLREKNRLQIQLYDMLKEIAYRQWNVSNPDEINGKIFDNYNYWFTDSGWNTPENGQSGIELTRKSSFIPQEIEKNYKGK